MKATVELFEKFGENLKKVNYHIGKACEAIGIDRRTYYRWIDTCPDFKIRIKDWEDERGDIIEARALEIAQDYTESGPSGSMVQFMLKTKFRNRGYKEVQELAIEGGLNFTMPDNYKGAYKKPKQDEDKSEDQKKTE